MRNIIYIFILVSFVVFSCGTQNKTVASADTVQAEEPPVRVANDSLEYEIIIIDPGFSAYLNSIALPESYYNEDFYESRNRFYVIEWNLRVQNPQTYNPRIYENMINYEPQINYGLEVNYKLFWYFQFAQQKYRTRLGPFRIYGPGGGVTPSPFIN